MVTFINGNIKGKNNINEIFKEWVNKQGWKIKGGDEDRKGEREKWRKKEKDKWKRQRDWDWERKFKKRERKKIRGKPRKRIKERKRICGSM